MKRSFRALQQGETPRPFINVTIEGSAGTPLPCLIDTGSLQNRFAWWVARDAGIDLKGVPVERIGVGGVAVSSRVATVRLAIHELDWEAPVAFCDPWPWDYQLLGQEGFLRWFVVTIEAAERRFEIRAIM